MKSIKGRKISDGIVFGKIKLWIRRKDEIVNIHTKDIVVEKERFLSALAKTKERMNSLHDELKGKILSKDADIFASHLMILEDETYINRILNLIEEHRYNSEYALIEACKEYKDAIMQNGDEIFRDRIADMDDVISNLTEILSKEETNLSGFAGTIVWTNDITPSELIKINRQKILAVICENCSYNSHSAILARSMNIPVLVVRSLIPDASFEGVSALLDTYESELIIEPDVVVFKERKERARMIKEEENILRQIIKEKRANKDGIQICANISNLKDLDDPRTDDADGIGLFRTEFVFLGESYYPSEEKQFEIYKNVLEKMDGKKVVFRTLDVGADKAAAYMKTEHEENPALGIRGIRFSLANPKFFKTQIRAILRAGLYGKAAIMFPMITSLDEVKQAKGIIKEVLNDLERSGEKYAQSIEIGIMIETPAAVMISDELASEVDFFSIGTNDLAQYSFAIDRFKDGEIQEKDSYYPVLMRMIEKTVESAKKKRIGVCICGEMAADVKVVKDFEKMGVDALSVSADNILPVSKILFEAEA